MISCQLVTNQFRGLDRTRVGQGMTGHESQTMLTAGGPTTSTGLKAKNLGGVGGGGDGVGGRRRGGGRRAPASGAFISFAGLNVTASELTRNSVGRHRQSQP